MARNAALHMKIVGQVSSSGEAEEIESIVKLFVVTHRIKELAFQSKGDEEFIEKKPLAIVFELEKKSY